MLQVVNTAVSAPNKRKDESQRTSPSQNLKLTEDEVELILQQGEEIFHLERVSNPTGDGDCYLFSWNGYLYALSGNGNYGPYYSLESALKDQDFLTVTPDTTAITCQAFASVTLAQRLSVLAEPGYKISINGKPWTYEGNRRLVCRHMLLRPAKSD